MKSTKAAQLTVTQATRQARTKVDRIMPDVLTTVESRLSYNLTTNEPTVETIVTFPEGDLRRVALGMAFRSLSGATARVDSSRITITRVR